MKMNLKSQIKKYLKKTRTKPYHLALKSNISPAILSRFLNNKRSITLTTAEKILKIIDKKTGI